MLYFISRCNTITRVGLLIYQPSPWNHENCQTSMSQILLVYASRPRNEMKLKQNNFKNVLKLLCISFVSISFSCADGITLGGRAPVLW